MIDAALEIRISSHNFSVKVLNTNFQKHCLSFCKSLVHYEIIKVKNKVIKTAVKVYACANDDRLFFRMHINSLVDFYRHLETAYVDKKYLRIIHEPTYTAQSVDFTLNPGIVPRDYQEQIIPYLTNPIPVHKLLTLQTGRGKTKVTLFALAKLGLRTVVVIRAAYTDRWEDDIKETLSVNKEDVIVIRGSKELIKLLDRAKNNTLTEKIIIISNVTLGNWFRLYEKFKDETLEIGYPCRPHELFSFLKAGVRVIDEVHQHFHSCFKLDCYTNIPYSISLSATVVTNDSFIKKMHTLAYPIEQRYKELELIKYINSYGVFFNFNKPQYIRTTEFGRNSFSMGAFEKSIMKNTVVHNNYLNLIKSIVDTGYVSNQRQKKRLIIFAATIKMIDSIVKHLRLSYKSEYSINRYTASDPYENILNSDITVTTLGSSGTGLDIPDLTTVIMTTMIDSVQANVQSLGRLRKLEEGSSTEFYYFVCTDISSSVKYHVRKKQMLKNRALTYRDIYTGVYL